MSRLTWPLLFIGSVAVGHAATLALTPLVIMDRAMAAMAERGVPLHAFVLSARITPATQTVVRPSPDLAYSICRYDLAQAPSGVRVEAAGWRGLSSVSVFDATTANIAALPIGPQGAGLTLVRDGEAGPGRVVSPTDQGLILIRRLAPSQAEYDAVRALSAGDRCQARQPTD